MSTSLGSPRSTRAPRAAESEAGSALARVGQVICDRWRLDELLGVGGMAAVYSATHRNGKRVAIKMLHVEHSRSDEIRQRFRFEGYAANRVGHALVVSVLDEGVAADGTSFLVMDLLEGETLEQQLWQRERIPPLELIPRMHELLDVLAASHANGIIHRDIKPDNLLIAHDGRLRVLDFGIAWLGDAGPSQTTAPGEVAGTPGFMSPEHARGYQEGLDGRSDLWAVGATMFYAFSGQLVHAADTASGLLLAAMTQPAPSLGVVTPDLPRALVGFVDRALAFDRDDRWPDARAMQEALGEVHRALLAGAEVGERELPRFATRKAPESGPPVAFVNRSSQAGLDVERARGWLRMGPLAVSSALVILGLVLFIRLLESESSVGAARAASSSHQSAMALETTVEVGATIAASQPSGSPAPTGEETSLASIREPEPSAPTPSTLASATPAPPVKHLSQLPSPPPHGAPAASATATRRVSATLSPPEDPLDRRK